MNTLAGVGMGTLRTAPHLATATVERALAAVDAIWAAADAAGQPTLVQRAAAVPRPTDLAALTGDERRQWHIDLLEFALAHNDTCLGLLEPE